MLARTDKDLEDLYLRASSAIRVIPPGWTLLDCEEEPDGTVLVLLRYAGAIRARVTIPVCPPDPIHPWGVRVYWSFDAPGFPWGCAQSVEVEIKDDAIALCIVCSTLLATLCDSNPTQAALALLWPDRHAIDRAALALRGE